MNPNEKRPTGDIAVAPSEITNPSGMSGRIVRVSGRSYDIFLSNGETITCSARGHFRYEGVTPLAGDEVHIEESSISRKCSKGNDSQKKTPSCGEPPDDNRPSERADLAISDILPRRNSLIRPPVANLDLLFVTIAAACPAPSLLLCDKMITVAEYNHIEPVIVITKSDLDAESASRIAAVYHACGFTVFAVSSRTGEGIADVRRYIESHGRGRICAAAGVSGAGKSTLMNTLFPSLSLEVGELSARIERGKNTTRRTELFRLSLLLGESGVSYAEEGFFADTPGFSLIDFTRFDFYSKEDLPFTFREFGPYLGKCRYTKCNHLKEEGCAILAAVRAGEIPKERHESYLALYDDLKDKHRWD